MASERDLALSRTLRRGSKRLINLGSYDFASLAAFKLEYRNYTRRGLPNINGIFTQRSSTFWEDGDRRVASAASKKSIAKKAAVA